MTHDWTNHSVTAILAVAQPIAVLDPHSPAGNRSFPRADDIADADVFAQHVAAPAVVVPGDPKDIHARIFEIGECRERAEAAARNHGLPLEPEVEEIAIDDQRPRLSSQSAQKRHERSLDLGAGDAKMRVRHDVTGGVQHGSN